jgi:hypothetical protein
MEKLKQLFRNAKANALIVAGSAGVLGTSLAHADDFDVTSITTMLTSVGAAVATIGAAVIVVKFGAKAWKWITSAG